ncbi:DUF6585 family protein [Nocardia sp. NPDC055321]
MRGHSGDDARGEVQGTAPEQDLGAHRTTYVARKLQDRLDLFEHGATYVNGAEPTVTRVVRYDSALLWQQITQVRDDRGPHTDYRYLITDTEGFEIELTQAMPGVREWGPELARAIATHQAPGALESLRAGGRVEFGDWWMSSAEFGAGTKSFALQDVHAYRLVQGVVTVEAGASTRLNRHVHEIPNFLVFQYLLRELRPDLPESAGSAFNSVLSVRGMNKVFAAVAVAGFAFACLTSWPVDKSELCSRLASLQQAAGDLNDPLEKLSDAAGNFRGDRQHAIRVEGDKLSGLESTGSSKSSGLPSDGTDVIYIETAELNKATVTIRRTCNADPF